METSGEGTGSAGLTESRLSSLIEKLCHPLCQIRLRALRNLRLKMASEYLAPPERFLEEQDDLYAHLKTILAPNADAATSPEINEVSRTEALLLIVEICKKGGPGVRRRLVEDRVLEAIDKAHMTGESLALGEDIRSLLLTMGTSTGAAVPIVQSSGSFAPAEGSKDASSSPSTRGGKHSDIKSKLDQQDLALTVQEGDGEERQEELIFETPTSPMEASPSSSSSAPAVPDHASLLFGGWKLPQVPLSRADEKRLFEFQVRFGIRHDAASLIDSCRLLRKELLEDYPPEIFLQRPQIVRQLLSTVRMPRDAVLPSTSPPSSPTTQRSSSRHRPEAIILEALASLSVLSQRLLASIHMHAQSALKAPTPPPSSSTRSSHKAIALYHPSRYPSRPPSTESAQGMALCLTEPSYSLSIPGFAFLVIDTLLPLTAPSMPMDPSLSPSRIPARAMAIIRSLLPFLRPPSPCPTSHQRLLHLLSIMKPLVRSPLTPEQGPLVLLTLDLLHQVDPADLNPMDLPEEVIKLIVRLFPHHAWLEPYVAILDAAALSVTQASKELVEKARPGAALLEVHDQSSIASSSSPPSPASWLYSALLRLDEALPLLALVPDEVLVRLAIQLWARSLLPANVAFLLKDQASQQEQKADDEKEDLKELATDVLLALLSAPLDSNRRIAHKELALLLAGEVTEDDIDEVMLKARLQPAPLKGHLVITRLVHEALQGPPKSKGALLRQLLEHGVRDPDDETKTAAWECLRSFSMIDDKVDGLGGLGDLLPLLIAARGQAYLDEGEGGDEGLGPGPKGLITRRLIEMIESSLPTFSQWILVSLLLDLFSPSMCPVRRGALRQLHDLLVTSTGQLPLSCTMSAEQAWAADFQASRSGASSPVAKPLDLQYPSLAIGPFAATDLAPLCDLLLGPSTLESSVRLAAAQQLGVMLAGRRLDGGKLPAWIQEKVWSAAYHLLNLTSSAFQDIGAELLVAAVWGGGDIPKLEALKRFLPFLYHSSHTVRAPVLTALIPPLFAQPSLWSSSPVSTQSPQALSIALLEKHANGMLRIPLSPRPRPALSVLVFVPTVLHLPPSPPLPRPLVPLHLVPPCPALPSVPLADLITALLPLWVTSSTSSSPSISCSLPPLVVPGGPKAEATSLVASLRGASSLKSFSLKLQQLAQEAFSSQSFCKAFLRLEWMQALSRLFQAPPATRRDEKLLQDALLVFEALVPVMGHRDLTMLLALAMECFLPVLLRPHETTKRIDQNKTKHKDDLAEDLLRFFIAICDEDEKGCYSDVMSSAESASSAPRLSSILATRSPLGSALIELIGRQEPPLASRTADLALHLLARLLPSLAITGGTAWPPISLKTLIRLAGRQHDPDSFAGSGITRAALECLRTLLSLTAAISSSTSESSFEWGPESLLRFISDQQTVVRALCYGCLGQVLMAGGGDRLLIGKGTQGDKGSLLQGGPNLFETALHVMADRQEPPVVAAEALGVVVGALLGQMQGCPSPRLTGSRVMTILNVVGEALAATTAPWEGNAKLHATLEALHTLLLIVGEGRASAATEEKGSEGDDDDQEVVDEPLLIQLIWQQGLIPELIRVIGSTNLLRANFIKASAAALSLPLQNQTKVRSSSAFIGRQSSSIATAAALEGDQWSNLTEEAWETVGDEMLASGQTAGLRVLRILIQRGQGLQIVKETALVQALVDCVEAHTCTTIAKGKEIAEGGDVDDAKDGAVWDTPRCMQAEKEGSSNSTRRRFTKPQQALLAEACRTSHQVLRLMSEATPSLSLPESLTSRILRAVASILQCENRGEALQNEALSVMTFLLSWSLSSSSEDIWGPGDAQVSSVWSSLFLRFTRSYDEVFALTLGKSPSSSALEDQKRDFEGRALVALAFAASLESDAFFRQKALKARLIPLLVRRLRVMYGLLIVESLDQSTASETGNGNGKVLKSKVIKDVSKRGRRGLKQLNERLSGLGNAAGRGSARYTGEAIEVTLLLTVLRAAVLQSSDAQQQADQEGFPTLALKLWPFALRLELDDPFALTRQRLLDASRTESSTTERLLLDETLLEVLLGCLCNMSAFSEEVKRSLLLTTANGRGADYPRTQDTVMHLAMRVALRPEVRPPVVEAAMGLIRSLGLTPGGRKILVQAGFLTSPCGATVIKALRGPGNRMARIQELPEASVARIFAVLHLMVNVTLASEGQKMLLAQVPGFSDLLEELLACVEESKKALASASETDYEKRSKDRKLVDDLIAQVCYLLRNLSFLRGSSKARILASKPLLAFLVENLAHPSIQVRFPASVAIWSLLYHSEKSLTVLRALSAQSKVEAGLRLLEKDEQEEAAASRPSTLESKETPAHAAAAAASPSTTTQNLRRALSNVRVLLAG